ncbi:hypothetical protein V8C44DRAFT_1452 [Trichoderma aethiopicum]
MLYQTDQQSHAAARIKVGVQLQHSTCPVFNCLISTDSPLVCDGCAMFVGLKVSRHRIGSLHCIGLLAASRQEGHDKAQAHYTASAILKMHQTCVLRTASFFSRKDDGQTTTSNRRRCHLFQFWMQHASSRLMPLHLDQDRAQFQTRESR